MLLQRREQVELERDARMAGGHDPVGDELALVGAAEMAVEADRGPRPRILERHQAARNVVGVGAADRIMARDPARGRAVAGFAADAVGDLEAGAARPGGVAWQPRHIGALDASPMPRRWAITWLRGSRSTLWARLWAPAALAGSCQSMISSWRTTGPSPSLRPWQVVPLQLATPT
jgi:hypothetical protein